MVFFSLSYNMYCTLVHMILKYLGIHSVQNSKNIFLKHSNGMSPTYFRDGNIGELLSPEVVEVGF